MFCWWALQAFVWVQWLPILGVAAAPNGDTLILNRDTPAPLVIPPSQRWEGNDGPWSSFFLRVGSPVQTLTVLISTASNQPLVVLPEGCPSNGSEACGSRRGGVFNRGNSTTWKQNEDTENGTFGLAIERNHNISVNALYGNDTVALSYAGSGAPSLEQQLIGGIASNDLYMGIIGLNPASTNFTDYNNPIESYMSTLKSQNNIPSLSYGYTSGSQYRFNKVFGSLTLGGYDASLMVSNDLQIGFNSDSNYDLTINVNSISMSSGGGKRNLSSTSFPAFIDSTLAYFYLPIEVCQKFEEAFGITYDNDTTLYLVNDTLHDQLVSQNANVTFTLTNVTSQVLVDVVLPYAAFDLMADYPLVKNATRYFPLKRAKDNTETALGRAFLQEAYLIADYERSTFSVHQRNWDANAKPSIQPILPQSIDSKSTPPEEKSAASPHKHTSTAIIVAAVVGGLILISILIGCTIFLRQRSQKLAALKNPPQLPPASSPTSPPKGLPPPSPDLASPLSWARSELDSAGAPRWSPELDGTPTVPVLPDMRARAVPMREGVHELPANEMVAELIGSPAYEDPFWRRQREVEEERRRVRESQHWRR